MGTSSAPGFCSQTTEASIETGGEISMVRGAESFTTGWPHEPHENASASLLPEEAEGGTPIWKCGGEAGSSTLNSNSALLPEARVRPLCPKPDQIAPSQPSSPGLGLGLGLGLGQGLGPGPGTGPGLG